MDGKLILRLQNILTEEKQELSRMQSELSALPQSGSLVIRIRNGRKVFYETVNGKERGITREPELVVKLARKAFLERSVAEKEKNVSVISNMLKKITENNKTAKLNDFIISSGFPSQVREWISEPCDYNPLYPEALKYRTDKGVRMRSKSERTIGNRLEKYNVPYKYECVMNFGEIRFYPDFTIMKPDGNIVIWEHLGLADSQVYMAKTLNKVNVYQKHGFRTHRNLILTLEEDLENLENIDRIIAHYVL